MTVCVSIMLVETEWFGSLNYISVLVHVTDDMRRCHEEYLNTHNLLTSIAVPSLPSRKIRGKELPPFSCKCCAQCHECISVSSNPCTKYPFLGSGVQNSNTKVKNNVVVPCRVNKTDDEVSLPPTSGENFGR